MPLQGIALAALTPLLREHGELSIQDMCVRVVLPAGTTGSYAEHLLSHPSTAALVSAKADVFVSYAWRYTLNQLVSALATHADAAKLFFWIGAFVIDQHAASASHATAEWMALFSGALASIGSAVVVLIPWDKPVPVSRAWCVFEHYALLSQRIRTEALLSPADAADFLRRLKAGLSFDEINAVFTAIDVETSQASRPEDRDAIMTQVRALGVAKVNATASSAVKSFMLARARAEAQSSQDALVFNGLGALLQARTCGGGVVVLRARAGLTRPQWASTTMPARGLLKRWLPPATRTAPTASHTRWRCATSPSVSCASATPRPRSSAPRWHWRFASDSAARRTWPVHSTSSPRRSARAGGSMTPKRACERRCARGPPKMSGGRRSISPPSPPCWPTPAASRTPPRCGSRR